MTGHRGSWPLPGRGPLGGKGIIGGDFRFRLFAAASTCRLVMLFVQPRLEYGLSGHVEVWCFAKLHQHRFSTILFPFQ